MTGAALVRGLPLILSLAALTGGARRRRAVAVDPGRLDACAGAYRRPTGAQATIAREGVRLSGRIAGLDPHALYPESDSSFFIKEGDLRVCFQDPLRPRGGRSLPRSLVHPGVRPRRSVARDGLPHVLRALLLRALPQEVRPEEG
jgi:hypothetical protein